MKPDPRVIFALIFVISAFAVLIREDVVAMAGLAVLTFGIAAVLRVEIWRIFGRMKRLWQALILVTILRSIFAPAGLVIFDIFGFPILTVGGIAMGILVALRLIIFLLAASMLTIYSTRALVQGLVQIKMPYEIAYMVSIGLRFVPQLREEMRDSLTALQLRGVVIEELKFKKRISLYKYLLLPVVVGSLQSAKELAMSMEMRAFRAFSTRTSFFKLAFSVKDFVYFLFILALGVAIGYVTFSYDFFQMLGGYYLEGF